MHKAKETTRQQARIRFADLHHVPIGLAVLDQDLEVIFWNRSLEQWTGISSEEAEGSAMSRLNPEWGSPRYGERIAHLFQGGPPVIFSPMLHPRIVPLKKGSQKALQVKATAVPGEGGGWWAFLSVEDVSVLVHRVEELRSMRTQQDRLMREIHHRVKNNLNMISGLITLQKSQATPDQDTEALEDLQSRIIALSEIHDILYRTPDLTVGSTAGYLDTLARMLDKNLSMKGSHQLILDLDPAISLKTDSTVVLGMIQAELMTNALKYGLGRQPNETLTVRFRSVDSNQVEYALEHTGDRLPEDFDPETSQGLGMVLLSAYCGQLGSKLQWSRGEPTRFWLRFSA